MASFDTWFSYFIFTFFLQQSKEVDKKRTKKMDNPRFVDKETIPLVQ